MNQQQEPGKSGKCKYSFNALVKTDPEWSSTEFSFLKSSDMMAFHKSLAGYTPTPLVPLPGIAASLGVKEVYVKDESHRFGIKAFKAFGASYAIYRFLKGRWEERFGSEEPFNETSFKDPGVLKRLGAFTFCAATDGNHGRAVAWTARKLGQRAVIYMPENTAPSRIENIENEGAEVILVPGTFDDCVDRCAQDAQKNGWQALSDTAYPGYMEIPKYIMLGYTSIFREIEETGPLNGSEEAGVDFVFLPAGVGGVAAAGTSYYVHRYAANRPTLICVEPWDCDCFLQSVKYGNGEPRNVTGSHESIMVGLNCGIPSPVAWPVIRDGMHLFIAITDDYAIDAMRAYHKEGVTSGESGAAGLAGLTAMVREGELKEAKEKIGLGKDSRILLLNTEGDTDPVKYREIIDAC
jgi:diaminopropionate ammonia-lyase